MLNRRQRQMCIRDRVYNREKHPFTTPPAQSDDDPMYQMFEDVLSSESLKNQPIYEPEAVKSFMDKLRKSHAEERFAMEGGLQRIVSTVLIHERFGMS